MPSSYWRISFNEVASITGSFIVSPLQRRISSATKAVVMYITCLMIDNCDFKIAISLSHFVNNNTVHA